MRLSGERLVGVIQPSSDEETSEPAPELYPLGCAGRIVQYAEIGDGRCFLTLMGVARFHLTAEEPTERPYRIADTGLSRRSPRIFLKARAKRRSTATT